MRNSDKYLENRTKCASLYLCNHNISHGYLKEFAKLPKVPLLLAAQSDSTTHLILGHDHKQKIDRL